MLEPNADDVKVALVVALRSRNVQCRTEVRLKSIYGKFPVDLAVFKGLDVVLVAEAKTHDASEMTPRQRTNYANCGCPAVIVTAKTILQVAELIERFVKEGQDVPGEYQITNTTYAVGGRKTKFRDRQAFERLFVSGGGCSGR